jgi:hypothetical protein
MARIGEDDFGGRGRVSGPLREMLGAPSSRREDAVIASPIKQTRSKQTSAARDDIVRSDQRVVIQ